MILVFYLASLFFIGISLYLVVLTIAAFRFRKRADANARPLRMAVVIPAHNEEMQIGNTIKAVHRSIYPEDCCRVMVIADNCEDETAAAAKSAGAKVVERSDLSLRGKGQALDWFFREQHQVLASFDAIAIIDADTEMDENFLKEISATLSIPQVSVAQGYYGVSNSAESWRTALMTAALAVFHHVRPAGRNRLGGSAGLKGNGMAFRAEILKRYGWPAYSVVEDLEFGAIMLLDRIRVQYNPDAIVRAEMAATGKQAESQRRRWEGGRLKVFRKLAPKLFRKWVKERQFCYFDGVMDLLIPPLSAIVLALGILLAASLWISQFIALLLSFAFLGIAFYVASGLVLKRAPFAVWLYLMAAPFFVLWKVPLYIGMLKGKGGSEWVRTQRKSEVGKSTE
jgi:cellulose synthase/poly-beta-1,6-N-acetylglucosamine synthase-like glycosyltransferase